MSVNKEDKYDRQLRLWASQGQQSLENAHILVVQPTITTLEALKNLILPGIGKFTILDAKKSVNTLDLSNNFYLNDEDRDMDKAEVLSRNLNELNHDVRSDVIHVENVEQFIHAADEKFWKRYDLVMMNWCYDDVVAKLTYSNIPLIVVNSIGFYGVLRIFKSTFEVIETHPQNRIDLRILTPWDELQQYSDSIDLDNLEIEEHAQIPYLIIQMKALQNWISEKGDTPKTSTEKKDFKALINSWKKEYNELNFDEAIDNSHKIYNKTKVPSNVIDILAKLPGFFEDDNKRTPFWILIKALETFINTNDGFLPLTGELPDMDSATENYIKLQNIYKRKHLKDLKNFKNHLGEVLRSIKEDENIIDDETIKSFVKNAKYLYFSINSSSPLNDSNFTQIIGSQLIRDFPPLHSNAIVLGFLLIQDYVLTKGGFPTVQELNSLVEKSHEYLLHETEDETLLLRKVLYEMLRAENVELSNISAIMGGIAGQEAIKIITKQYVPLDNLLVYDGIRSESEKWKVD